MSGIVVINPASGARKSVGLWRDGLDSCARIFGKKFKSGTGPYRWPLLETSPDGRWLETLEKELKNGLEYVACVGGDGTIASVARLCRHFSRVSLLLIPGGRGNDAIRGLYDFSGSSSKFWAWAEGRDWSLESIDMAEINGRTFFNMASFGYGGHIVEAAQDRKALWSRTPAVYMIEGAISFFTCQEVMLKVSSEGQKIHEERCFGAFVGNGRSNGSGLQWTKNARFNDGNLDFVSFSKPSVLSFAMALSALRKGQDLPFPAFYASKPALDMAFDQPVPLELDGDYIGNAAHYKLRAIPNALKVWVPKK